MKEKSTVVKVRERAVKAAKPVMKPNEDMVDFATEAFDKLTKQRKIKKK